LKIFQIKSHVDPLIADGRLRMTEPGNPQNYWQRYVSADCGAPITLGEIILDFCKEPRTRQEIAERAGIHIDHMKENLQPLIAGGKLKMTIPAIPTSTRQRFVIHGSDIIVFSEEALIEFCRVPRVRIEIMKHFDYNTAEGMKNLLRKLLRNGKIKYLNPEMSMCRWRKYIKAE